MGAYVNPIVANFSVPDLATKKLKFKVSNGVRKLVISSNWLPMFNFNAGDSMVTRVIGCGKGLVVELANDLFNPAPKKKKVYQRTYPKRKNNPCETLIEISSKKIVNEAFLFNASGFHVKFEFNRLTITPITDFKDQVMANARFDNRYSIFAACSSGVDLHLMEKEHGFNTHSLIEWRPREKDVPVTTLRLAP
jgi:DNA (cytosine-5)-methyltransferase 1